MAIKMNISTKVGMALVVSIGLLVLGFGAPGALLAEDPPDPPSYFLDCGNFESKYNGAGGWDDGNYYYIKEWYCINNSGKKVGRTEGILKTYYTDTARWAYYYLEGAFLQGKAHGWWNIVDKKSGDYYECFYDDGKPETDDEDCPEYLISLLQVVSPDEQNEENNNNNKNK